ncbi:cell wall protein DAN4 isoform X1 [Bradysia coprophila]|uniref:cell wall protein DAN4 isoform X1 n=1 Tax=Bradysia coprophila TaxID=38358 RepID=UPI00187D9C9F|nr:cell wall protein DAN4 isoform X1 [Bradysia coprophila]XP_037024670.1 cell wall protein DAN4 isoform X1 [Bradysia coprophila]
MDTVTGSRKYFQNIADNSYYRNSMNRSFLQTNYSSYQNTLGRNSLGPFTQTSCSVPYQNDASLHSQYGYNSWGMWKDSRNLTPSSTYSSKSNRRSVRSFTILLMTAVFIVVIAIFGFAALAFYFSTYKADTNDSMMMFDGKFQVLKGDTFTTGLKYNHTSAFQQKAELYQGLITKSLEKNGIEPIRCSVIGFGTGPLINVIFRIIVDMRKIPLTIKSVEDHIRESIANEASNRKSIFNNISIDIDSINIQRLLDHEALKSASFVNLETTTPQSENFDNTRAMDKVFTKPTATVKSSPTKVGLSNMPIQGSFEVTKTDADISQKKSSPTTSKTSTLRPFTISNTGMRIKSKKTTIEKVKNPTIASTGISHVNKVTIENNGTDTRKQDSRLPKTSTTAKPPVEKTTTTSEAPTTATEKTTTSTTTTTTTESSLHQNNFQRRTDIGNPPKLDANLFTTAPIIDDDSPWLPINPISPQNNFDTVITKVVNVEAAQDDNGNGPINILPRNKIRFSEPFDDSFNREMLFHSFTNPAFTYLTPGIETLGSANLRPYPIPVNKIIDEPDSTESVGPLLGQILPEEAPADNNKSKENQPPSSTTASPRSATNETITTESTISLGDVLSDLLEDKVDNNRKEYHPTTTTTTAAPETTTTINFKNIKEYVLLAAKNNGSNNASQESQESQSSKANVTKKPISTSTLRNFAENGTISTKPTSYVEVETVQYTPVSESWNQPALFPVQSKFEYVNGTMVSSIDHQTIRRIFNETLHAWIIENSQRDKINENEEILARKNNSNIQNISAIFDTLASELGIQPNISTKSPPFELSGQFKLKDSLHSGNTKFSQKKTDANKHHLSTTSATTTTAQTTTHYYPIKSDDTYGEAEIEEIDPTQYEQILLNNNRVTSTTVPSLVTLMPVKSNSGIRQRTPMIEKLKMTIKNSRRIS